MQIAVFTNKFRLANTVSFFAMTAIRAGSACVLRIYEIYRNTCQFRFVSYKTAKFVETPTAMPCFLRPPKPFHRSLFYPFQIFESKSGVLCLSLIYKVFRYAVIFYAAEILFTSTESFQQFVNRARTFAGLRLTTCLALKQLSLIAEFLTDSFNFQTCKRFACGVSRKIDYSKVNSDYVIRNKRRIFGNVANTVQKELSFAVNQIYFAFAKLEQFSLMLTHYKRNVQSAINSPDRNNVRLFERDYAVIVGDRPQRFESGLFFVLDFIRIRHLRYLANHHLRAQVKQSASFAVNDFMQVELRKCFRLKSLFRNPITRLVCFFHSFKQSVGLHFERLQFEINNQFHRFYYRKSCVYVQVNFDSNALLPTQFPKRNMGRVSALFF